MLWRGSIGVLPVEEYLVDDKTSFYDFGVPSVVTWYESLISSRAGKTPIHSKKCGDYQ